MEATACATALTNSKYEIRNLRNSKYLMKSCSSTGQAIELELVQGIAGGVLREALAKHVRLSWLSRNFSG